MGTRPPPRGGLRGTFPRRLRPIFGHRHPRPGDGNVERGSRTAIIDIEGRELPARGLLHVRSGREAPVVRAPGPEEEVRVSDETPEQSTIESPSSPLTGT